MANYDRNSTSRDNEAFCKKMQKNLRKQKGIRNKSRAEALKARNSRPTDDLEEYITGNSVGSTDGCFDYYLF